jgi:hypothetical protein
LKAAVVTLLRTKPAAIGSVLAAAWAIFQAVWAGTHGHGWDADALYGLGGALFLAVYQAGWIHRVVTPLARPRNNEGQALVAAAGPTKVVGSQ